MKLLLVLVALAIASCLQAQEWSAPVNVSNMNGGCDFPDYCIDNNGILHCVWVFQYQYFDRTIMYSRSTDNGTSWSAPIQISENASLWMAKPQIKSDTQNNLHVIYNYDIPNLSQIHYRKHNGQNWEEIVNLSGNNGGQINYCMSVDNNDKVYVFWGIANEEDYHSYYYLYSNNEWSDAINPFPQSQDHYLITTTIVDANNNLQCAGYFHLSNATFLQDKAGYTVYNSESDYWSDIVVFDVGAVRLYEGIDITLDVYDTPHIVWHVNNTGVYHVFFNGISWSDPVPLSVSQTGLNQRVIIDDTNTIHLVQQELTSITPYVINNLFYYCSSDWERKQLTYSFNIAAYPKLIQHVNTLYLLYAKNDTGYGGITDVFMIKKQLWSDAIDDHEEVGVLPLTLFQNYPNPFCVETNIIFRSSSRSFISLEVYNVKGQHIRTLYCGYCDKGDYDVLWDGRNSTGELQPCGIYIYRANSEDGSLLKRMILLY